LRWEEEYFYDFFYIYLGIYVELFFIASISLLIIFFVIYDYIFKYKFVLSLNIGYILILIFLLSNLLLNGTKSNFFIFEDMLREDSFSIFIQNILIINFIFYIIMSLDYIFLEKIVHYEYFLLVGISFLGMIIMVKSNDLISLYLALELQSLVFYIISSFKIYSNFSTEAGLKYFILGSFSSGILLLGCSFIYGFAGTTNFSDLRLLLSTQISTNVFVGILVGVICVIIGIFFKLGAVPFHM
jgi:NADH:ubiquinone oxidoreductase subunit 2 (subunit N)